MLGIFEDLVDREAVTEELPDLFAGVQSGAAGWQRQQGEVVLNNEGMGDVPSGGVRQNDSVYAGGDRLADFLEQKAHCSLIQYICQGFVRIVRNA